MFLRLFVFCFLAFSFSTKAALASAGLTAHQLHCYYEYSPLLEKRALERQQVEAAAAGLLEVIQRVQRQIQSGTPDYLDAIKELETALIRAGENRQFLRAPNSAPHSFIDDAWRFTSRFRRQGLLNCLCCFTRKTAPDRYEARLNEAKSYRLTLMLAPANNPRPRLMLRTQTF